MGRKRNSTDDLVRVMDESSADTDADDAFLVDSDGEDDMPHTQPVDDRVLKDVIAYVEVRTKTENRSKGVSKQLELLGAKVEKKFTNDVTHIVWKDGKKSTRDKAVKKGIRLVSVLWVDSCKQNQEHVAESLFPVAAPDDKDLLQIGKLKRMKSMQPKEVEEDIQRSAGRGTRKKKARVLHPSPAPLIIINPAILVAETQPMMSPITDGVPHTPSLIPDTPSALKPCLDLLDSIKKRQGSAHRRLSITDSPNISPSTPLRQRLFQCFTEEVNSCTESPSTSVKLHKSGPVRRPNSRRNVAEEDEMEIDTPPAGTEASSRGGRRRSTATPSGTKLAKVEEVKGGTPPVEVVVSGRGRGRRSTATPRGTKSDDVRSRAGETDKAENNSSSTGDDKDSQKKGQRSRDISLNRKLSLDCESSSSQEATSRELKKDSKSVKDGSVGTKRRRGSSKKVSNETVTPVADTSGTSETGNMTVISAGTCATGSTRSSKVENSTRLKEDCKSIKDDGAARLKRKRPISSKEIDESVSAAKHGVHETSNVMIASTSGTGSSRSSTRRRSCLPALPVQPSPEDRATDQTRRRSSRRKSVTPLLNQPSLADHLKPVGIRSSMDTGKEGITVGKGKGVTKGASLSEVALKEEEMDCPHPKKKQKSLSPIGRRSSMDSVREDSTVGKRKGVTKGASLSKVALKEEEMDCHPKKKQKSLSPMGIRSSMDTGKEGITVGKKRGVTKGASLPEVALNEEEMDCPHPKKKQKSLSPAGIRSINTTTKEGITVGKRKGIAKVATLSEVILIEDEEDCHHPMKKQKSLSPGGLQKNTHDGVREAPAKEYKFIEKENHSAENATPMALGKRIGSTNEDGVRKRKLLSPLPSDLACSSVLSSIDVQNRPSIEEFKPEGSTRPKPKRSALKKDPVEVLCTSSEESAVSSEDLDDTLREENKSASTAIKGKKTKIGKKVTLSESLPTNKKKKSTIVMTSLHRSDQEIVIAVVNDLGRFEVTDTVCETTTHVVIGENRRTLNVLSGITRGCWIVSMDWVYRSVEAGAWLPEEPYEMNIHFPGAMISRLAHGAKSDTNKSPVDIFSSFDALYVPPESNPPRERLVELIEMCGGHISRKVSEAKLCVGGSSRGKKGSTPVVAERWILDCITRFKLLPWDSYKVNKS